MSAPQISLWQGNRRLVRPTGPRWINLLGNVSGAVTRLTSRVNGGPEQTHWTGPDARRLTEPGDFNIEIARADLGPGVNRVIIGATDINGRRARTGVILRLAASDRWPLPWHVDWTGPDSYEISDGRWRMTPDGLRISAPGYDRMLTFGDAGWRSYDLITHVTFHAAAEPLARAPTFGVAHVALAAHWPGHGADMHRPHLAWHPLGVTCEWQVNPGLTGCRFRMLFGAGRIMEEPRPGRDLVFGEAYALRLRVQADKGRSRYAIRAWSAAEAEPDGWTLTADKTPEDVPSGAAALLAHNTDVTFGPTRIIPL